jgi:hypothetical protein
MFDANYFRTAFPADVAAAGGSPIVELLLTGGHAHRVSRLLDVADGRVTFEAYQMRGELAHQRPRFGQTTDAEEVFRVVIACENIVAVVFDPSPTQPKSRPGFA